jgi:glucokinase
MNSQTCNVGVDIGGTNIKFGITDSRGSVVARHSVPTHAELGSDAILSSVVDGIRSLLAAANVLPGDVESIGVGVPGTADSLSGTVIYAPNLFWKDVPVAAVLEPVFGVPVHVAQDTRAAVWAEYLVGAAQGASGAASVTLGTGIGCGLVLDGCIFHGALNTAGEFGHQIVQIDGAACNCGRHGCLEAHAGGLALVRNALARIPDLANILGKPTAEIAVHDIYQLAESGNPKARELTDEVVRYVGIGLVNLINLTSVEIVALSGGISNAPDVLLLDPLTAFVRTRAYVSAASRVRICRSALGDDAPMIGASLLLRAREAEIPQVAAPVPLIMAG